MKRKICFLVCEHLRREAELALQQPDMQGFDGRVVSFDAQCHKAPGHSRHLPLLLSELEKAPFDEIHVIGAQCLPPFADHKPGSVIHRLESCFYLLCNRTLVDELISCGAYLISPGWLLNWRRINADWGFTEETAAAFFAECTREFVLLDTGVLPESSDRLEEFSAFSNQPSRRISVGTDVFKLHLVRMLLQEDNAVSKTNSNDPRKSLEESLANYAMAFDLIGHLDRLQKEADTAAAILEILQILFAPARLVYYPILPVRKLLPVSLPNTGIPAVTRSDLSEPLLQPDEGLALSLEHEGTRLALVVAEEVALPEKLRDYRNLAAQIAPVFGMAVANVRAIEKIREQERQLSNELQIASIAQRELLQKGFSNDDLTVRTIYAPYRWVSGDFFGFSWFVKRRLLRGYLLDVTGHGVATALQTAATSVILNRALIESPTLDVALMEKLNPQMMQYFTEGTFAAVLLFEFDLMNAELRVTGGGIHHFYSMGSTSGWQTLPGSYAGLLPEPFFGHTVQPIVAGDSFSFMTDGISERLHGTEHHFAPKGFDELCATLQENSVATDRWDDCAALCIRIHKI